MNHSTTDDTKTGNAEEQRLEQSRAREKHWKRWGPYVSERAWGTVREDYSASGSAWEYFPHDHARSRAYRWNEDGLAGICDRHQNLFFALALWNGHDPILKERLFGLTGNEGNHGDLVFLESIFHKLLLNFTWWVNRKDDEGMNVFQGGFLGLDNIGVFNRSAPLPTGGNIEQSDGTSWMAMYALNLLAIASELAMNNPAYENVASKFWEHFLYIAHAMNNLGAMNTGLWDDEDGFFYDVLHAPDDQRYRMKVRSMVGLIPLFAVATLEQDALESMPSFHRRLDWFIQNRSDLTRNVACMDTPGDCKRRLLSVVDEMQLRRILFVMLDEQEFLSDYGIRALSRIHEQHAFTLRVEGVEHRVAYEPGDSTSGTLGGNSNWRGPIWFPLNYLIIESLQKFHHYYGDDFQVECPTGSGTMLTLTQVAVEISRRLSSIFMRDESGNRPVFCHLPTLQTDPHWKDLLLFYEYFHGNDGSGVGASHQTGWTALVAKLLQQSGVG